MIILSEDCNGNYKKIHCPVCGGRLCDVKTSEKICKRKIQKGNGIVVKCYKCGRKINILID